MIRIKLNSIGKQFDEKWIFKGIELELNNNNHLSVTGYNGSGKSTFLQLLTAYLSPTEGSIVYEVDNKTIEAKDWYSYISCGAPYIDLPEDLTVKENIVFFNAFKSFQNNLSTEYISEIAQLSKEIDKPVKYFSSGMKQRLKLTLAITADVPVLFLDEPTSNLDNEGVKWYKQMIEKYANHKMVIICSNNQKEETATCTSNININNYH